MMNRRGMHIDAFPNSELAARRRLAINRRNNEK